MVSTIKKRTEMKNLVSITLFALASAFGVVKAQEASSHPTAEDSAAELETKPAESALVAPESSKQALAETPDATPAPVESTAAFSSLPSAETAVSTSEDGSKETSEDTASMEKRLVGINVNVNLASIYNFRGLNAFLEDSQQDQNGLFLPSLTWAIFSTGIYLGYYGGFQISGNNISENVANAVGHEQGIYTGWDYAINDMARLGLGFAYIFYPFADEELNGTSNPSVIEPLVSLTVSPWVDISLEVSYFIGIFGDAYKDLSHLYFRPAVAKSLPLSDRFAMNLALGLGIKVYTEMVGETNNMFDLLLDWSLPIALVGTLYMEPGIHLGWTNFNEQELVEPESGETVTFGTAGDEFMVYGGLNVGADF